MGSAINDFLGTTGIAKLFDESNWWQYIVMYVIVGALFYLAVVKKFEPLLLLPIAFGMLLANLPGAELIHLDFFFDSYYVAVEDGEIVGTLSHRFQEFISNIDSSTVIYSIDETAGTLTFDFSLLTEEATNEFVINFNRAMNGFATVDSTGVVSGAFDSNGQMIPDFASAFGRFMEEFNKTFYNIDYVNSTLHFDFSRLSKNGIAAFEGGFEHCMNGAATLDESGVHIKMSTVIKEVINYGGLVDILYLGVKLGVYPSLIFLGVGAMTDFSPLIANPKSLLMGAGAQFGVFVAFFAALFIGFTPLEAGAIGIIGGADGPTAILVTKELAPQLLGAIAIAAYSYMALIPIIQPPFMRLLTTEEERKIKMKNLRQVSKLERVIFPIVVTGIVCLIIPDAAPLVGFLMLGNLFNVSGVTDRLSKTAQNELINIITICLGVSVGATANAENFLKPQTLYIIALGLTAFIISTCGGLITGKIMCKLTGGKINPLIGAAGVSAVPMAARVAQDEGRKADPSNFLLMHAMGPNVAGVIGSAVAAGVFLSFLG